MEQGIIDAILAILIALFGHVAHGDKNRLDRNQGLNPPPIVQKVQR